MFTHLFVGVQEIPSLKVKVDDYTHHTGRCVSKGMHILILWIKCPYPWCMDGAFGIGVAWCQAGLNICWTACHACVVVMSILAFNAGLQAVTPRTLSLCSGPRVCSY